MHTKKSEMGCQKECLTTKTRQFLNPNYEKENTQKKQNQSTNLWKYLQRSIN
jgi:hypothetical protein